VVTQRREEDRFLVPQVAVDEVAYLGRRVGERAARGAVGDLYILQRGERLLQQLVLPGQGGQRVGGAGDQGPDERSEPLVLALVVGAQRRHQEVAHLPQGGRGRTGPADGLREQARGPTVQVVHQPGMHGWPAVR
jgi:hypothetical protein